MAYKALCHAGLPFDLIRSEHIKKGELARYPMLFVPGGWASNKLKSLGEEGISEIRTFVEGGGSYLGLCGGAGLATLDGIGLLKVKRKPTKERVPSFSGRIRLDLREHPIWSGLGSGLKSVVSNSGSRGVDSGLTPPLLTPASSTIFHAWWPSQFLVEDEGIRVLASYGEALPDAFSSDLNVGDVGEEGWTRMEEVYSINLNPKRLMNDPSVIEGTYGKGRVVLSLVHFDTADDLNGAAVLKNLWAYLGRMKAGTRKCEGSGEKDNFKPTAGDLITAAAELESTIQGLISLGMRNFLWFWRNPMLLQWKRGVRGLEYCTLYIMLKEISGIIGSRPPGIMKDEVFSSRLKGDLDNLKGLLLPFVSDASRLLIMERLAMQNGHITYEKCDDPEIRKIRTELFSDSKSHGGLFKKLIDGIDGVLYRLIAGTNN